MLAAGLLVVLTLGRTRFPWYSAPVYPLLAMLIASVWHSGWQWLTRRNQPAAYAATGLLAILIAGAATAVIWRQNRAAETADWPSIHYDAAFRSLEAALPPGQQVTVLCGAFNSALDFHLLNGRSHLRYQVQSIADPTFQRLQPGHLVLVCTPAHAAALEQRFDLHRVVDAGPCQCVQLRRRH